MLRLTPSHPVATLWDSLLPPEAVALPEDWARLDALLAAPAMLEPVHRHWDRTARDRGRPTLPMAVYVRLLVVKHRTGWGYETLVREVSDSLHLRRFCLWRCTSERRTNRRCASSRGGWARRSSTH